MVSNYNHSYNLGQSYDKYLSQPFRDLEQTVLAIHQNII